jgi:hypothetical protein
MEEEREGGMQESGVRQADSTPAAESTGACAWDVALPQPYGP